MNYKTCTKCGEEKPATLEFFYGQKTGKYGLRGDCKHCQKQYKAKYYAENKEAKAKYDAKYRAENKEAKAKYDAKYYAENKEAKAKSQAKYRAENKEAKPGCVYALDNDVNSKVYIGETTRGELRWKDHIRYLRGNYHGNPQLQKDFNEYGEEAFGLKFRIIQEYPKDKELLLLHEALEIERHIQEGIELYNAIRTIDQLKMLTEHRRTNEYIRTNKGTKRVSRV